MIIVNVIDVVGIIRKCVSYISFRVLEKTSSECSVNCSRSINVMMNCVVVVGGGGAVVLLNCD